MLADTQTRTMTVAAARELLSNTYGLATERVDAAQQVVDAFQAKRPRRQCFACGSGRWSEHLAADGNAAWACSGCHRPPMSLDEWHAEQAPAMAAASII